MYSILLGAPGAGKGTQAAVLAEGTGLCHVATGDLFREHLGRGTELGKLAKSFMERGALVPDDVTVKMVQERLAQEDCANGAILDGFPRTLEQARALDQVLADTGRQIDRVVYIDVPTDVLLQRLSGRWLCRACQAPYHTLTRPPRVPGRCDECGGELYQRPDDTAETALKRLDVYAQQTAPLVDHYRQQGKLVEVDGNQPIDVVQQEIRRQLGR